MRAELVIVLQQEALNPESAAESGLTAGRVSE